MNILLRPATRADADAAADVYLASRRAFIVFAPCAHSDSQVRRWIAAQLIPAGGVTLAVEHARVGGMMSTSRDNGLGWIDQLYVAPGFVGNGIGSQLLAQAKSGICPPLRLYTFQANTMARRFYERRGVGAIAFGDGRDNEEKCPDVLYGWAPVDTDRHGR